MSTWESVLLPDPFGPMTAWTSPLRTSRSTERRISLPGMAARSPLMLSTLLTFARSRSRQDHHHVLTLHAHLVDRHRLRGREGRRLARAQREGAAVLPALDLQVLRIQLALRQREVGVAATVADGVEVVPHPDQGDAVLLDVEAPRRVRLDVGDGAQPHHVAVAAHGRGQRPPPRPACASLPVTASRGTRSTPGTGARPRMSSKKPSTMSRSAASLGIPRLSR